METKNEKLQKALQKHKTLSKIADSEDYKIQEQENQHEFQKVEKIGFLGAIIGFIKVKLLGMIDPAYEKYILLKQIQYQLKNLPIQIYNSKTYSVTKKFGKLLFELYKYIAPLKNLINIQQSKQTLIKSKEYFVKYFMNEKQKNLYEDLTGDGIIKLIEKEGLKKSIGIINEKYKELQESFDKDTIRKINLNFSILLSIDDLLRYDLYPLVKKFCPALKEEEILDNLDFKDVHGEIIAGDIKDLSYVLYSLNTTYDMRESFKIYSQMKGKAIISDEDIKSFQLLLRKIISEDYLTLLIKIIDENPFFRPVNNFKEYNVINDFFNELSLNIKNFCDSTIEKLKENKINTILQKLFNTSNFETLKNYNNEKSELLYKKGVKSFIFTRPLNYLKMFIKEIYNKYIRDITNKILIEAIFVDKNFNQKFSNAFLDSNELMNQIIKFDEEYIGSEKVWERIKSLLPNVMREQKILVIVNKEIEEINKEAETILKKAINSYSQLIECYKIIVEEYKKSGQEIISNLSSIGDGVNENKEIIETIVKAFNETQAILALLKFLSSN